MIDYIFNDQNRSIYNYQFWRYSNLKIVLEETLLLWNNELKNYLYEQIYNKIIIDLTNQNNNNTNKYDNDTYIKNYIFDMIYTQLLIYPLIDYISKPPLLSTHWQSTSGENQEFHNKLFQIFAVKTKCDPNLAEEKLFSESCAFKRQQLCLKIDTLQSMIHAIKSEFPLTKMISMKITTAVTTANTSNNSSTENMTINTNTNTNSSGNYPIQSIINKHSSSSSSSSVHRTSTNNHKNNHNSKSSNNNHANNCSNNNSNNININNNHNNSLSSSTEPVVVVHPLSLLPSTTTSSNQSRSMKLLFSSSVKVNPF